MTTMRLAPTRSNPGRPRRWTIPVSIALHAFGLFLILTVARRPEQDAAPAPSYDLVFQGMPSQSPPAEQPEAPSPAPAEPQPQPESGQEPATDASPPPAAADALPGPLSPEAPITPPTTLAMPTPSAPSAPAASTPPPLVQTAPDGAEPTTITPSPPEPVRPQPQPQPSQPPQVRLQEPPAPARLPVPEFEPPIPPEPAPEPAQAAPRTAPNGAPFGTLANPMDLSFGPGARRDAAARSTARPGSVASRSIDLSLGAPDARPGAPSAFAGARGKNALGEWMQGVAMFWQRHRFYPEQARAGGESGAVEIELTVERSGQVRSVVIKSRSGSRALDMAAVSVFRDARLPPLPREIKGSVLTIPIPISYFLQR